MGLHARIHRTGAGVTIAFSGPFRSTELGQAEAILRHFKDRGCAVASVDTTELSPASASSLAQLHQLIGTPEPPRPKRRAVRSSVLLAPK